MIRFVCAPDGTVTPDIRARLPGRGVWVGARAALVAEATKKRMFARGLKEKTEAPPDLAAEVLGRSVAGGHGARLLAPLYHRMVPDQ